MVGSVSESLPMLPLRVLFESVSGFWELIRRNGNGLEGWWSWWWWQRGSIGGKKAGFAMKIDGGGAGKQAPAGILLLGLGWDGE